jgi:hypothetical protein
MADETNQEKISAKKSGYAAMFWHYVRSEAYRAETNSENGKESIHWRICGCVKDIARRRYYRAITIISSSKMSAIP